jgi:hypothetical protein
LNKILFPVSTAKKQAISITIGEAQQIDVHASPILLFPLCCTNTIGPAIRTAPVGKVQRIKKIRKNFLLALRIRRTTPIDAAKVPRFTFKRRVRHSANNVSIGIAPIQLVLRRSQQFTYLSKTRL